MKKKIDINELNEVLGKSNLKDNTKNINLQKKVSRVVSNIPLYHYNIIKNNLPYSFSNYVKMLIEKDLKKRNLI